jgi:hypothetical protein
MAVPQGAARAQNKNASIRRHWNARSYNFEYTTLYQLCNEFILAAESVGYGHCVWGEGGEEIEIGGGG